LDPLNPVGAKYVIEEKAEGKPLGSLWYQWEIESQLGLVTQLVDFETKLAAISFRSTAVSTTRRIWKREVFLPMI
jgi:hypothetical protein